MQSELIALLARIDEMANECKAIRRRLPNGDYTWRAADDAVSYCYQAAGSIMLVKNTLERRANEVSGCA